MLSEKNIESEWAEGTRVFSFANLSCSLRKWECIKPRQNQEVETDNLINYPSQCSGNTIRKTFEIQFPHHTLILTDHLQLTHLPPTLPHTHALTHHPHPRLHPHPRNDPAKKLVLFRSKIAKEAQARGDKKNIAKNVVTAYLNFLRDGRQDGENWEGQVSALKGLIDRTKFNNHLVNLIISNPQLRPSFRLFLGSSAAEWVHHSKLKNKDIHLEAIELYQRLCDEKQTKSRQNQARSREDGEMDNDENEYLFQSNINHQLEDEIKDFK